MTEAEVRAIFLLAGLEVESLVRLPNGYLPEWTERSPWWEVETMGEKVTVGWRKRVIAIDWTATPVRQIVTTDDVTKDETMVHAWTRGDAVDYLATWKLNLERARYRAAGEALLTVG